MKNSEKGQTRQKVQRQGQGREKGQSSPLILTLNCWTQAKSDPSRGYLARVPGFSIALFFEGRAPREARTSRASSVLVPSERQIAWAKRMLEQVLCEQEMLTKREMERVGVRVEVRGENGRRRPQER